MSNSKEPPMKIARIVDVIRKSGGQLRKRTENFREANSIFLFLFFLAVRKGKFVGKFIGKIHRAFFPRGFAAGKRANFAGLAGAVRKRTAWREKARGTSRRVLENKQRDCCMQSKFCWQRKLHEFERRRLPMTFNDPKSIPNDTEPSKRKSLPEGVYEGETIKKA